MLGSQSSWYFSDLAGIKLPEGASGWDSVEVSPSVPVALDGVSATVGTVRGAIEASWTRPPPYLCAEGQEKDEVGTAATVNCTGRGHIDTIEFASFGLPNGTCGDYTQGCHSATSMDTVRAACLGKTSCAVLAETSTFGGPDPCPGQAKRLVIQATCTQMPAFTMSVKLPAGIRGAELKVPLGNLSASSVTLKESNVVVWQVSSLSQRGRVGRTASCPRPTPGSPPSHLASPPQNGEFPGPTASPGVRSVAPANKTAAFPNSLSVRVGSGVYELSLDR